MTWQIRPEPAEEEERQALLAAVERALQDDDATTPVRWWRSGLDELGGGPSAKESWRDAGVVET